jgi:hypothetical protein
MVDITITEGTIIMVDTIIMIIITIMAAAGVAAHGAEAFSLEVLLVEY